MRLRPPSFGFCWLAATLAVGAGLLAWVQAPQWYERPEPARTTAQVERLVALGARAGAGERDRWLREAFTTALASATTTRDWRIVVTALEAMRARGVQNPDPPCLCAAPGLCWLTGVDGDGRGLPGQRVSLVVDNRGPTPRHLQLRWQLAAGTTAALVDTDGRALPLQAAGETATCVLPELPAGSCRVFVLATPAPAQVRFVGLDAAP